MKRGSFGNTIIWTTCLNWQLLFIMSPLYYRQKRKNNYFCLECYVHCWCKWEISHTNKMSERLRKESIVLLERKCKREGECLKHSDHKIIFYTLHKEMRKAQKDTKKKMCKTCHSVRSTWKHVMDLPRKFEIVSSSLHSFPRIYFWESYEPISFPQVCSK